MEQISGIISSSQIFKSLKKVSDLIYYDGPLLSHYKNNFGDNYLFYWVDVDDVFNRWLLFRISGTQLNNYLNKRESLLEIISKIPDTYFYSIDIDNELNYNNVLLVQLDQLPTTYLPKPESFYSFKPQNLSHTFDYIPGANEVGLLQASFTNSHTVGYGTIYLDVLSPTLHHINEMTNGMGISYYKYRKNKHNIINGDKKTSPLKRKEIISNSQFEVAGFSTGSFVLLLRPLNRQIALPGQQTDVDDYCNFFISFVEASAEYPKLMEFISILDNNAITHYEKLLKNIQNFKLTLKLKWANPQSNFIRENILDYKIAPQIIENITKLEYTNPSNIILIGRFLEVNLKTSHYTFISHDENSIESTGNFNNLIKEGTLLIKFNQDYQVSIDRIESKETNDKKPKIKDTLIAFYEVK